MTDATASFLSGFTSFLRKQSRVQTADSGPKDS